MVLFMENHQTKYRYERKYVLEQENLFKFYFELSRNNFYELYPERQINNLYLDTHSTDFLEENIEGLYKRKKSRIRWYGPFNNLSNKTLEIKQKRGEVNFKEFINLGDFEITDEININSLWDSIIKTENNESFIYMNNLQFLTPKLFNSYSREYYSNQDQSLRITIDKDLKFTSHETNLNTHEKDVIIEFKFEKDHILNENKLSNLKLNKYSKYVKGLLSTTTFDPNY